MRAAVLSMILAAGAAGVYVVAAQAQAAKTDPAKADPRHYKVEMENESVRVLRVHYEPGEKSVMHYHPKSVAVFLGDGKARMTTPDGKSEDREMKAGTGMWSEAGSHMPQNMGTKAFDLMLVELKK